MGDNYIQDQKTLAIGLTSAVLGLAAPQSEAQAADLPGTVQLETTTDSGLSFSIVPFYVWLPGMNGTVGVFGTKAKIDMTPIDIIENLGNFFYTLDGLYVGTGEVRYRDFGFLYDVFYIDVSSEDKIDAGIVKGPLNVGFSQTMITLVGTYREFEEDKGYLYALAGVRIWDINLDSGLDLNIGALHRRDGDTWVDPIIGGKGRYNLTENAYVSGWAMVGGFGAGSDFMWDVWANVGYLATDWIDLFAGFRAVGADFEDGTFIWDVTQYGPVLGATIKLN